MKIVSVVGARPQFIKAAPVSKALHSAGIKELLVHTGQHYDDNMSDLFFRNLEIPEPDRRLGVGSGPHGWQTGKMLTHIEEILLAEKPSWVIVYGDTNSTLSGALAAVKLNLPLAHVEAGLRSFNRKMPEEHNRVLADHCSDLLFCPTDTAVKNLNREGITNGIHLVGDTMYDAFLAFSRIAQKRSRIIKELGLTPKGYLLATVHRAENTDVLENLRNIITAFLAIDKPIVFPVHPRTKKRILEIGLNEQIVKNRYLRIIEPVGYLDMIMLEKHACVIMTDSGGIQKEAYFCHVPCVTLRGETEWVETVDNGWNTIVGANTNKIVSSAQFPNEGLPLRAELYGDGRAAEKIVRALV